MTADHPAVHQADLRVRHQYPHLLHHHLLLSRLLPVVEEIPVAAEEIPVEEIPAAVEEIPVAEIPAVEIPAAVTMAAVTAMTSPKM